MDFPFTARGLSWAAIVGVLVTVHLIASGGTLTIKPTVLQAVAITPETTLSRWWNHLVAGFVHTSALHIVFNLALFSLAFPYATRSHSVASTLAAAYAISLFGVLILHLALVRPLAAAGWPYAQAAMTIPLVGFSVIAYATAGMAVADFASPLAAFAVTGLVVAFELGAGLGRFTGPFIFVYHVMGFFAGIATRWLLALSARPSP